MLDRFEVDGFRNLPAQRLEFGKINVFIGPNNSGKSNLFDAISFCRGIVATGGPSGVDVQVAIESAGGGAMAKRSDASTAREVALRWAFDAPGIEYGLRIGFPARPERWVQDWRVLAEVIQAEGVRAETGGEVPAGAARCTWSGKARDMANLVGARFTLASSTGWRAQPELARVAAVFDGLSLHTEPILVAHCARFPGAVDHGAEERTPGVRRLAPRGDNLANVLRELEGRYPFLDRVRDHLAQVVPGLTRITTADAPKLIWTNLHFGGVQVPVGEMSDGTVQLLRLAALLFGGGTPATLLVDEPEVHLHPAWQRSVGRWFEESPHQTFISTHSPELLDAWTESYRAGDVRVFVVQNGLARPVTDDPGLASRFAAGWQLGDLYRVGDPLLGGWPF